MKNPGFDVTEKLVAKYLKKDSLINSPKSTNINTLLNRVKTNQRNEKRKKIYFSAAASTGLFIFGFLIYG